MAWVTGVREVRQVAMLVVERERAGSVGRIPGVVRSRRVCRELSQSEVREVVRGGPMIFLPEETGAGPCGSLARGLVGEPPVWFRDVQIFRMTRSGKALITPLVWTVDNLVAPLRRWYATGRPHFRIGAKCGPRGRRAA